MISLREVFPVMRRNALIGEWIAAPLNLDPYRELSHDEEGCSPVVPMLFIADVERDGRVTAVGTGTRVIRIHKRGQSQVQ